MAIESEEFRERGHHTHRHTHTGDDLPLYGEDHHTTRPSGFFLSSSPLLCPSGKDCRSLGLLVCTIERPPDSSGDKGTSKSEVAQSCLTLCDPMDCSLPGFSIHGIFQARVLEWVAVSFSRGSSWPRDRTRVSHTAGRHFTVVWATREATMSSKTVALKLVIPQDPFPLLKIIADLKELLCVVSIKIYHVRN